jgi:hypothetical protein
VLTKNAIIKRLSGCLGWAQPEQRKKRTKKKKEVIINKIFTPMTKISIILNIGITKSIARPHPAFGRRSALPRFGLAL